MNIKKELHCGNLYATLSTPRLVVLLAYTQVYLCYWIRWQCFNNHRKYWRQLDIDSRIYFLYRVMGMYALCNGNLGTSISVLIIKMSQITLCNKAPFGTIPYCVDYAGVLLLSILINKFHCSIISKYNIWWDFSWLLWLCSYCK